jgi:muconolactone delta-isomerase
MGSSQANRAAAQARMRAQQAAMFSGGLQKTGVNRMQRNSMSWDVASNMIQNAPLEKIELLTGSSLKLYMKSGVTFVTKQPSNNAYVELIKKNPNKIEIIK